MGCLRAGKGASGTSYRAGKETLGNAFRAGKGNTADLAGKGKQGDIVLEILLLLLARTGRWGWWRSLYWRHLRRGSLQLALSQH